jgi:hypothetical protein
MCNAYNHAFDCPCGFGGDTGGGGGRAQFYRIYTEPLSSGWAKDSSGTIESYVNPNAHCPVCGEAVYFYRSPYNGRVFFDELGWPWPKHPCTDNSAQPRRATRGSVLGSAPRVEPAWRAEGWSPLLSVKVYSAQHGRSRLTGDLQDEFLELYLPTDEKIDRSSPVFIRVRPDKPYIFEVSFLCSDAFCTRDQTTIAFSTKVASLSDDTIRDACRHDPAACNSIGQFLLGLDDPIGARPYLEQAVVGGLAVSLYDLAVLALLPALPLQAQ